MEHPVYRFGAVLRRLRNDAGLTVLAAAEATGYGKYERWESGQTRLGGQYLATIADVFGVADDLHLLVYAWLLDRLTPAAGEPAPRLDLDELRCHLNGAPDTRVDLGDDAALVLEPGRHADLALLLLAARYADRGAVALSGADRAPLPPVCAGVPPLVQLYGDTLDDALRLVGRQLLARGLADGDSAIDVTNIAPTMTSSTTYERLADSLAGIDGETARPTVAFAVSTAPDARHFAELLPRLHAQVRELLIAAGRPSCDEDVEQLTRKVLAGKTRALLRLLIRATRRGHLPATDPALTAELLEMRDRLRRDWRDAVAAETVIELRDASATDAFEALEALRRRHPA
jgi:transcriptional regulator with XRE-family HTH domain